MQAFHGRTSGAVAATDNPKIVSPFNATPNVTFVPLDDIEAVRRELATGEYAAAIIEGIQGVSGIHEPSPEFLRQLREATEATGTMLILDEIQSGYGRTGSFFAHQPSGIRPDLITAAKGIANGFPMGAVLISPRFEARKGMLGTTFGGNHLACAAALAVLDVIEEENLIDNAAKVGDYLLGELRAMPGLKDVRGRGLMIGVEIEGCAADCFSTAISSQAEPAPTPCVCSRRCRSPSTRRDASLTNSNHSSPTAASNRPIHLTISMKTFTSVADIGSLTEAIAEARAIKADRFADASLGRNRTLMMVFFNSSLRTRLSTQKAALNLGMNVIVLDINQGAWKLETERGVIMDGDKPEHLLEAIPVMGCYADIIGVRAFASLTDKKADYEEQVINQFIRYSGRPVFSMEAATGHPLQAFADVITIEEHKTKPRPKVVLTWAPHPRALPQAVPNSFAQWTVAAGYDVVITHPRGYELAPEFTAGATIEYDREKAFSGADFIYAKNWSAYADPDYGKILSTDRSWTVDTRSMALTDNAFFMHCLPVRRNMIVTDDVIESERSLVIPEAANREISAQTVLKRMLQSL